MAYNLISSDAFNRAMDEENRILLGILSAGNKSLTPKSWGEVQYLVRNGLAKDVFAIGDQLTCMKGGTKLIWDIIGIDHDTPSDKQFTHSMTLQLHDCLPAAMQFDAPEALYYCAESLGAGTYHFALPANYEVNYGGGKTYQFTLSQSVPQGGVIMFPWAANTQASATKISVYADNKSSVALETVSVSEDSGGISLGTADRNSLHMNHVHRIRYGSNNYAESNLRRWLNSAESSIIWTPSTEWDRPSSYMSGAGFMADIDADFLSVIGKVDKIVARNTVTDGGDSEIISDRFFLLSRSEVFADSPKEGQPYPYYRNYGDGGDVLPNHLEDSNRIRYLDGVASWWWLRSANLPYAEYACGMMATGKLGATSVHNARAVVPACCIV